MNTLGLRHWWGRFRGWRDGRLARKRDIPAPLWDATLRALPFLNGLPAADSDRLRGMCGSFLSQKEFHGAHGLTVTDEMAVSIAAQACLPVLNLGLDRYSGFVGIIVQPQDVVVEREHQDEAGVVHRHEEVLSGEAMDGGPMMLSWTSISDAAAQDAIYNVVIHEFAHVLDMRDGLSALRLDHVTSEGDGDDPHTKPAPARLPHLSEAYWSFCEQVDAGEDTLMDPYGSESIVEFFAVGCETFFLAPIEMRSEHPDLYASFARYFRQDPASRLQAT